MNSHMKHALIFGISLIALTGYVVAQPGGMGGPGGHGMPPQGGPGGEEGEHPVPPIIGALDVDLDKVISAEEITNSSTNLLTLDANSDGQLTEDELRPAPPEGEEAEEGQRPPRRRGPGCMLVRVLDADADRTISAEEIANAPTVLLSLDRNEDGQLSMEDHPGHGGGHGGPGGGHGGPGCHGGPGGGHGGPGMGHPRVPGLLLLLDADQNGELSAEEIAAASAAILEKDANGDGIITLDELRPTRPEGDPEEGNPMAERLMALDTDEDGYVSFAEFCAHIQPIFDRLDGDDDGQISQAEAEAGPGAPPAEEQEDEAAVDTEETDSSATKVSSDIQSTSTKNATTLVGRSNITRK